MLAVLHASLRVTFASSMMCGTRISTDLNTVLAFVCWLSVALCLVWAVVAATCVCVIGAYVIDACADLSSVRLICGCMIFAEVYSACVAGVSVANAGRGSLARLHLCWCLVICDEVLVCMASDDWSGDVVLVRLVCTLVLQVLLQLVVESYQEVASASDSRVDTLRFGFSTKSSALLSTHLERSFAFPFCWVIQRVIEISNVRLLSVLPFTSPSSVAGHDS